MFHKAGAEDQVYSQHQHGDLVQITQPVTANFEGIEKGDSCGKGETKCIKEFKLELHKQVGVKEGTVYFDSARIFLFTRETMSD